jgi:nicotinamide riboside kinase
MSIAAQLLLIRKKFETWILWIIVDMLSIGIYFHKEVYLTMFLYVVFLCMATQGYFEWKRKFFETKRIVVVGSESTGKTTLAKRLVDYFRNKGGAFSNTQWVAEYGRDYTYEKLARLEQDSRRDKNVPVGMDQLIWIEEDFIHIGKIQTEKEDQAARISGPVLICDTDAFATAIWHERYRNYLADQHGPHHQRDEKAGIVSFV